MLLKCTKPDWVNYFRGPIMVQWISPQTLNHEVSCSHPAATAVACPWARYLIIILIIIPWMGLRLISHDSKVRNLNLNSKCAFWIKIRKTVVWTVCTPKCVTWNAQFKWWSGPSFELRISNYESRCDLAYTRSNIPSFESSFELRISNYASQCNFGVHTVQTTVFRILIQNALFKLKFKLRTLLSCENSLKAVGPLVASHKGLIFLVAR